MTTFVGVSATDFVAAGADFRIVIERSGFFSQALIGLESMTPPPSFPTAVTTFYNGMLAKTGVVYPVSPNPAVASGYSLNEQSVYSLDVKVSAVDVIAGDYSAPVTAADVVNRLNAITSAINVVRFQAITDADLTDAASRDALVVAQTAADAGGGIFGSLTTLATLAVVAVAAYALILVSKEFSHHAAH